MPITRIVHAEYGMVDGKYTKIREEYPETIAHGCVLEVGTKTVQIMSDIWGTAKYARYWDMNTGKPAYCEYDVNDMGWAHGDKVSATVDATEEVKALYFNWMVQKRFEELVGSAEQRALEIEKGCIAEVVSGKTGKGSKGKVVAVINGSYGMGYRSIQMQKFGIATSDVTFKKALPNGKVVDAHQDMVWAWAKNVRRVDKPKIDKKALLEQAIEQVAQSYKP